MYSRILSTIAMLLLVVSMTILPGCDVSENESNGETQESVGDLLKAVGAGSKVIAVSAGNYCSFAIVQDSKNNKTLWTIGSNIIGELGVESVTETKRWINTGLKNVTLVASGGYGFTYCVSEGYLWVTGNNDNGQLGLGHTNLVKKFTKTIYSGVTKIAAGGYHGLMLSRGNLWATGLNHVGQLGINSGGNRQLNTWTALQIYSVNDIACGDFHSLMVTNSRKNLYVTGYNSMGQLGLGYWCEYISAWTLVPLNVTSIESISCGYAHSAIAANGPLNGDPSLVSRWLWVTGDNRNGQLGISSTTSSSSWLQLGYGISRVACGKYSSFFTSNGQLWSTGGNWDGQLGLGDYNNRITWEPTIYGGIPDSQSSLDSGSSHSMFISNNQTWAAGSNSYQKLGVESFTGASHPWFQQN